MKVIVSYTLLSAKIDKRILRVAQVSPIGLSQFTAGAIIANNLALATQEGRLRWDTIRKALFLYDTQRARGITPIGWMPYAFQIGMGSGVAPGGTTVLPANGGALAVPIALPAPMNLRGVSVYNADTAMEHTWQWGLFEQYLNQGNIGENTLVQAAVGAASETFTPSAASWRTINSSVIPLHLPPGLYWLVIQNQHAANSFSVNRENAGALLNAAQTKTITNPFGTTLDFVAPTWTKLAYGFHVRLNGHVFGENQPF